MRIGKGNISGKGKCWDCQHWEMIKNLKRKRKRKRVWERESKDEDETRRWWESDR